jgi:hydrogenase expression/formation protein HypD
MNNKEIIKALMNEISHYNIEQLRIMEVCGTHTQAVSQSGIRSMLPPNIALLSGPGCPVCVTDERHIDEAIEMLNEHDVILATFGDMMRVKGTQNCILDQLNKRKNIVVVYSPLDCLELARKNPERQVVFFAVGFETTAPSIALTAKLAQDIRLDNLSFLTSLKLMPPVLHSILSKSQKKIHGIICPGHVAAVMGAEYFRFLTLEYEIPAVICGFEAIGITAGLHFLSKQYIDNSKATFGNLYKSCVSEEGNTLAQNLMQEYFVITNANWRGIGEIEKSALVLAEKYSYLNALKRFNIKQKGHHTNQQCNCREVLLGSILPYECKLFGKICTPQRPSGPCMISAEGSCSTYYRYRESAD